MRPASQRARHCSDKECAKRVEGDKMAGLKCFMVSFLEERIIGDYFSYSICLYIVAQAVTLLGPPSKREETSLLF